MLLPWLDRLGDWNPQLWREVKQRVNLRSFLATTAASLLGQWWLVRNLGSQAESLTQNSGSSESTIQSHLAWRLATFDLLSTLTWIALWLLMIAGSYLLAKNLLSEIRRGTLTFLRLSGYPAWKILLGKVLGVPILLHWTIVLALPLQLWMAIQAGTVVEAIVLDAAIVIICAAAYVVAIQTVMDWKQLAQLWIVGVAANFFYAILSLFGLVFVSTVRETIEFSVISGPQSRGIVLAVLGLSLLLWLLGFSLSLWRVCSRTFNQPIP